ncbi:hypothetical protein Tco_1104464 [Tanacetum coccineum]
MNPVATQQVALDNALVALEKRLKIEKCNMRIKFNKPQREPTFQVTVDVLKLSPCYPAFLITAEVPEIYMHQFWNTITKIKDTDAYRFKLDTQKFRIDIEVFREILQICPRLPNQDFIEPPSDEEMVSFIKDLRYISGKSTNFVFQADNRDISSARKENMPYQRFTKKQTLILDEESAKMPKWVNHVEPAKKSAPAKKDVFSKKPSRKQSTGVQIRDTSKDAQMKKVLKRSKRETHFLQASGSGDRVGSQPKVPDELQDKKTGTNEGTESGYDDDDSNDDDVSDNDDNDDDSDDDCNNPHFHIILR